MKRHVVFIAGISNIGLPVSAQGFERYADRYEITSDRSRISRLVEPYRELMGLVEFEYIRDKAKGVIYRRGTLEDEPLNAQDILEHQMSQDMLVVQNFLLSLWLVKDNAADVDNRWLFATEGNRWLAHTNSWAARPSRADGTFELVDFSVEDFRRARTEFRMDSDAESYLSGKNGPTMLGEKSLRYQRFLYLVGGARSTGDVAIKLALYCSALESLVSTSQSELSHQVSERVASLIEDPGASRIERFKILKEAYGYRSKAVHGASFKGAASNKLRAASLGVDEICRELCHLYLNNDGRISELIEGGNDQLDAHFLKIILGPA